LTPRRSRLGGYNQLQKTIQDVKFDAKWWLANHSKSEWSVYTVELQGTKQTLFSQASSLWLVGLITALAILPVFLVELPAMNDYPGHLARMYLLASIGTPNQNPYYYFYLPFIYPNLVMDIVVPIFARFMDVASATKAFLILSQILVVSGAVALEMAIKRRHEFAGFAGAAVLYCLPFAWGFLNFEFGVGLALWGLASWFALESKELGTRFAAHALFCCSLFVCHLVAFGLYGVTLAVFELWRAFQPNADWKKSARILAILAGPGAVILGYFFACTANIDKGASEFSAGANEWSAFAKLISILHGMNGYSAYLSAANILAIVAMAYFMFKERCLSIMPQGKWIAVGFLILILFLPFRLFGGDLPNLRIAIGALLILPAFLTFRPKSQFFRFVPALVLSLIALVNAGHIASLWLTYRPEYAALQESFKQIQRGAFVLVGHANFENDRFDKTKMPIMTATALAAHYSNAFVPTLFTIPGQQPLQVCPELKRLALRRTKDYWPVAFSVLAAVANGASTSDIPTHVRDWMHDYDYLYLVGPPGPNPMPSRLTTLTAGKSFTLYRIIKPPGEGNALGNGAHRSGTAFGTDGPCQQRLPFRSIADSQTPGHKKDGMPDNLNSNQALAAATPPT
jgi:hypothetical protein